MTRDLVLSVEALLEMREYPLFLTIPSFPIELWITNYPVVFIWIGCRALPRANWTLS